MAKAKPDPDCPGCAQLVEEVAELKELVRTLHREVAAQGRIIADLRERLGLNSMNSHFPPSSDRPDGPGRRESKSTGRKRGGQPGHEGRTRELVPPELVDEVIDVKPEACRGCGGPLSGDDPAPWRKQTTDIPPIVPTTIEHRLHRLACPDCGITTRAELPAGVPRGAFGPRLTAITGTLTGAYRMSKRNVGQVLEDMFGVSVALGSITAIERSMSEAVAAPVKEAAEHVRDAERVNADETGWKVGHERAWLWTAATEKVAVFRVHAKRGTEAAKELLGSGFAGILTSDRWCGYNWLPMRRRQVCWSHLRRDFEWMAELEGRPGVRGRQLTDLTDEMFDWLDRARDGTLKWSTLRTYLSDLRCELRELLEAGARSSHEKSAGKCRDMLKHEKAMWTFVRRRGLEPTNNAAERALRQAVIWRKTSFGTQSDAGSRYVERMLTVTTTLRLQGRNVLKYLTESCRAALQGRPAPSLLPIAARA